MPQIMLRLAEVYILFQNTPGITTNPQQYYSNYIYATNKINYFYLSRKRFQALTLFDHK